MRLKPQLEMLKKNKLAFGGDLFNTRKGRLGRRPIDTKHTMHLVLRSSKAIGDWSFKKPANEKKIRQILEKFAQKYGIKILSAANVGNHIHLHFKLGNRHTYKPFVRAVTSAIAMAVTGINRWTRVANALSSNDRLKFWDRRPFTRVIQSFRALLNLRDYIKINVLEGFGVNRNHARLIIRAGISINTA